MASTALMKPMLLPAVTTTRLAGRTRMPFSRASFVFERVDQRRQAFDRAVPMFVGCAPNCRAASSASGGGPYDTTPWPSEIVPGVASIQRPTVGMTGG